jgi:dihydroorotate dehydrogenase
VPDWSYQTFLRPLLFSLPAGRARDLTLAAMGRLAELPLGPGLIELMGHMSPPPGISQRAWDVALPSPIGLSAGLDAHARGLRALARLGFGFLEIGSITEQPLRAPRPVERRVPRDAVWYPDLPVNDGMAAIERALVRAAPLPIPLGLRLAHRPWSGAAEATAERCRVLGRLAPYVAFVTLETR